MVLSETIVRLNIKEKKKKNKNKQTKKRASDPRVYASNGHPTHWIFI